MRMKIEVFQLQVIPPFGLVAHQSATQRVLVSWCKLLQRWELALVDDNVKRVLERLIPTREQKPRSELTLEKLIER